MNSRSGQPVLLLLALMFLASCASSTPVQEDVANDPFPTAQAELRAAVRQLVQDVSAPDIEGLQAAHLESEKFTKFGPRSFNRQDVASTNESEAAFFGSVSNFKLDTRDLKIDVFGNIGIVTYYPHVSFVLDGEEKQGSGRQTLVFLRTDDGWKIVHEHGTPMVPTW